MAELIMAIALWCGPPNGGHAHNDKIQECRDTLFKCMEDKSKLIWQVRNQAHNYTCFQLMRVSK